jgi:hypothetical protein
VRVPRQVLQDLIRHRLDALGAAATTAAEALDGAALGLPEGTLAAVLAELVSLGGRLDLALDRLADALDPVAGGEISLGGAGRSEKGACPMSNPPLDQLPAQVEAVLRQHNATDDSRKMHIVPGAPRQGSRITLDKLRRHRQRGPGGAVELRRRRF